MSKFFYLVEIQFLGFRYHGWQKQPGLKTVQEMVERTVRFVLDHDRFKTLSVGRTDARVSAHQFYFELFLESEINESDFLNNFKLNLPPDIQALGIRKVDAQFNIIQHSKIKEYHYNFSYGEKHHPFAAPFMTYVLEDLDIDKMMSGARLMKGNHNFQFYCYKPSEKTIFQREVNLSIIEPIDQVAEFFPKRSYVFRTRSAGFMRHQVRMMMGTLIALGKGILTLDQIRDSLEGKGEPWIYIAPSSGLTLYKIEFEEFR